VIVHGVAGAFGVRSGLPVRGAERGPGACCGAAARQGSTGENASTGAPDRTRSRPSGSGLEAAQARPGPAGFGQFRHALSAPARVRWERSGSRRPRVRVRYGAD
jgi:hypothetical protein